MTVCEACGHRHEGPGLGGICVGCPCERCPCERRAAERGLSAEQVGFLRRQVGAMMRRPGCPESEVDGHRATLRVIAMLMNETPDPEPGISGADNK